MPGRERLHIVAAVVTGNDGRILASTRPAGRSMSGRWEFPGGKLESGESRWSGLMRELREELGLTPVEGHPLIRLWHDYPDGPSVDLDVWRVTAWEGQPEARERQQFDWFTPDDLTALDFLDANTPIVAAARLPDRYLITPADIAADAAVLGVASAAKAGIRLIQLRGDWLNGENGRAAAEAAIRHAHAHGAQVLVNTSVEWAGDCGADGVHLPWRAVRASDRRPVPRPGLVGVSCHGEGELRAAEALGADFATLGHVRATPTHPDRQPLGEERLFELADQARLPVYALGGMAPDDLPELHRHGVQGIAAIRALWPRRV